MSTQSYIFTVDFPDWDTLSEHSQQAWYEEVYDAILDVAYISNVSKVTR